MKSYAELAGDGGSDILGQVVSQRRRMEKNLEGIRHLLAVGSGKGGVGKSTITMLLALAFQARGWRTAILDADFNGPTQARLGDLPTTIPVPGPKGLLVPRSGPGIGVVSLGSLVAESEPVDFPSVAAAGSYVWRASQEFSVLGDILARTDWSSFDTLLIDLPPGAERTVQYAEFLGPRASFVLLTLPSRLSEGVVGRSASALKKAGATVIGSIENMSGYFCPACREVRPLFPASSRGQLGIPCLGRVPFDPRVALECDTGVTLELLTDSLIAVSLGQIADSLVDLLERANRRETK